MVALTKLIFSSLFIDRLIDFSVTVENYRFVIFIVITSISTFNNSRCLFRNGFRWSIIFVNVDDGWLL